MSKHDSKTITKFEKAMTKRLRWYENIMEKIPQKKSVQFMCCNICEVFHHKCSDCELYSCYSPTRSEYRRSMMQIYDRIVDVNVGLVKKHYKFLLKLLQHRGYTYK